MKGPVFARSTHFGISILPSFFKCCAYWTTKSCDDTSLRVYTFSAIGMAGWASGGAAATTGNKVTKAGDLV